MSADLDRRYVEALLARVEDGTTLAAYRLWRVGSETHIGEAEFQRWYMQQAEDLGYPPQQYTWNAEAKRRKMAA